MKSFIVVSSAVFVLALIASAEGLKCYECEYLEGGGEKVGEASCKSGKTPDDKLVVDCPNLSGFVMRCGKLSGKIEYGGEKVKGTTRGCYAVPSGRDAATRCGDDVQGGFYDTKLGRNATSRASTDITTCICDTDKCNSSSMVAVSSSLILISTIIAFFKL